MTVTREVREARAPQETVPAAVAGSVQELLDRSREALSLACQQHVAHERFTTAHLAALRASAAVIAAHAPAARRRSRPRSVWEEVSALVPELSEWAAFFAAVGRRRLAGERGAVEISARECDDLLRAAENFHELVLAHLRLPIRPSVITCMVPVTRP